MAGRGGPPALPPLVYISSSAIGIISKFHSENSDFSDICRNNARQWDFLDSNISVKLWSAIAALGVVAVKGGKNFMNKMSELERIAQVSREVLKHPDCLNDYWVSEY